MNWIEELQEKYPIEDKEVVFQKPPELDPTKPTKVIVPQNGGASTTEKGLHSCPLCNGYNFILSIAGGYFCEVCQSGHEGQKVIAGSTLPRPLKMDKAIPKKRGSVSRPPKKKTSATIIPLKRG
ncbi:MAG: hypothetical protein GY702_24465, partial [Desulfobulbaceae bacterium]|nr:hypothetical protein [Desulfobulbaceae bacterium]